jgi:hypothetical protein
LDNLISGGSWVKFDTVDKLKGKSDKDDAKKKGKY